MFRISELARHFGLSRSTLLYYDRIGLLSPSGRSAAGYRLYSTDDKEKLAAVSRFRKAGLPIEDIRSILYSDGGANAIVLQRRIRALTEEINVLQTQQRLLGRMLQFDSKGELPPAVDKQAWVDMLCAAGMDDAAMTRWHAEFERRAPYAHHQFLLSLGIIEDEAVRIRKYAAPRASLENGG